MIRSSNAIDRGRFEPQILACPIDFLRGSCWFNGSNTIDQRRAGLGWHRDTNFFSHLYLILSTSRWSIISDEAKSSIACRQQVNKGADN